ncbi:MAG: hypothetical protein WB699_12960 [Bacteroidota bacterium]
MKQFPFICLVLIIAPIACKDVGSDLWEGWNQRHIRKASFAIPADMQWVCLNGVPWGLTEYWGTPDPDMRIRVMMYYAPGLDTSASFPRLNLAIDNQPILMNGYAAQRLTFLDTSDVWIEVTGIWIPDLRDHGNQMLFMVEQYGKPSPKTADDILRSLRVQ